MKNIYFTLKSSATSRLVNMLFVAVFALFSAAAVGCSDSNEKEDVDKTYTEGVNVTSNKSELCNSSAQMLTITFETDNGYVLDTDNVSMITFFDGGSNSKGGKHQARIQVRQNDSGGDREAAIYITVTGHNRTQLMSITQKAGASDPVVQWVDERLQQEYYWLDEYNDKHNSFDFTLSADKFLSQSLLSLTTNIDDGGYDSKGNRYVYSYIQKISGGGTSSGTRATSVSGYGLFLASTVWLLEENGSRYGFAVEHVYPGSSAEAAGIRRGDIIGQVKGNDITSSNLNDYWYDLQYGDMGTITVQRIDGTNSSVEPSTVSLSVGYYQENPVAYSGLITLPEAVADSGKKIGYLSYLSFDADYDTELIDALRKLGEEGITDLILDLRVNGGGSVNSSILLASSILGSSYEGKIYATLDRHEKNKYDDSVCKLVTHNGTTALPSLNMPALWVIASNGTASASEMVIVGLDGLDVPVTVVGARTEGKNCGMDVIEKTFGSTTYSYAPITFLNLNAKGFNDYGEGIEPDIDINSYMSKSSREEIQYFARTFPMPTGDWGVTKKDLALFETVMQICGKSVLDTEQSAVMQPGKLEVATSMTRAGEPLKLEHKRRVFGATLTADERERMRADE
jgi:C-terminal processing protease CtpA/Prc